jgi:hypothetical protein
MDVRGDAPVSWEQILNYARSLEGAAEGNGITPEQAARLVRLVLRFQQTVVAGTPIQGAPAGLPRAAE